MQSDDRSDANSNARALGDLLRTLRATRRMTLRDVEHSAGVSNAYLSQLEQGKIAHPSPHILHKLATHYAIPYEDLMAKVGYIDARAEQSLSLAPAKGLKATSAKLPPAKRARASNPLGELTKDEEEALLQYLAFLRSRSR
jgi:transcriptional regulator with XRE-family HTH domain